MRLINRPLAFLLALALVATGVIVAIEVVAFALDTKPVVLSWPTWEHWASTTRWNRAVVKVWSIILIVVGLVLVLTQLKPRRPTRVRMVGRNDYTDAAMTRRGLAAAVRAAVLDVDGIAKAQTVVSRRSVRVTATASAVDSSVAEELSDPVTQAAQTELLSLDLQRSLRVRTTVEGAKS